MDFVIARAMCERKVHERLRDSIPKSLLAPDTVALLGWIELFYATYPDSNEVHFDVMDTLLNMRGAHLQKEQLDILKHMLKTVQGVPEEAVAGTVRTLNELAYSGEMAALVSRYQAGEEVDFVQEAKSLERKYSGVAAANDSLLKWEDGGVDDILAATDESGGLKLTVFSELSRNIRGLRGGDCVAVAAPVDAGKTSLLAATVVSLAEQMHQSPDVYADRPILWLVNESLAKRTVPRIYQAATDLTLQQIVEQHKEGKFADKYLKKVGTWDKIRVKDAHSMSLGQISTLLEEMRPAVLVIDMVANIKGGNAESEYQALEQKWQQLRMLGCEYDCIILGTIQLSVEGYDCMYPPLTALKGSKIGVQGALDLCIMMGRMNVNDRPDMANVRGISTPKNKLGKSGSTAYVQFQVEFNGGTCQFMEGLV